MLKIQVGVTGSHLGPRRRRRSGREALAELERGPAVLVRGHRHGLEGRRCVQRIGG